MDFHEDLYLQRIDIKNPTDKEREVRLFFHHDLYISSHEVGDTAYYEPERRAVYHYKGARWFLINAATPGKEPGDAAKSDPGPATSTDSKAASTETAATPATPAAPKADTKKD